MTRALSSPSPRRSPEGEGHDGHERREPSARRADERRLRRVRGALFDGRALDANLPGGRFKIAGDSERVDFLTARFPRPGRLVEWSAQSILTESRSVRASCRRRHGAARAPLSAHLRWPRRAPLGLRRSARTTGPDGGVLLDTRIVERLGKVVEHRPMVSRGWSGNALEQLVLADGCGSSRSESSRARTGSTITRRTRDARRCSSARGCLAGFRRRSILRS